MAGFKLTQKKTADCARESASGLFSGLFIGRILFRPGRRVTYARVDRLNVSDRFSLQPFLKRLCPAPYKNANAALPGGAYTKDTAKMHPGLGGKFESFVENAIADARGEK